MSKKYAFLGSTTEVPAFDEDAQLLFDAIDAAGGSTSVTEKDATSARFIADKLNGTYALRTAWYLDIGGTVLSCQFNAKDPRDLDAAYRLTYFGGWIFSANGAKPNGTNAYAHTHLQASTLNAMSGHASMYSGTDVLGGYDIGADYHTGMAGRPIFLICRYTGGTTPMYGSWGTGNYANSYSNPNGSGFHFLTFDGTNDKLYKGGTNVKTTAGIGILGNTYHVFLGAANAQGIPSYYSAKEQRSVSIGLNFSAAQVIQDDINETIFQTALGRNV